MTGRLFDSALLARRRDRAMRAGYREGGDFLIREVATMVAERLDDIPRAFPRIAILGTGAGAMAGTLRPDGAGLVQLDPSPEMAAAAAEASPQAEVRLLKNEVLNLEEGAFDLVISALLLHHANDPVGHLVQMRRALKPDGLMLAALFGGETLVELRASLAEAETEVCGGLSPRVAPMGEVRDLGALIGRAGYAMPVADRERLVATYETPLHLLRELRAMGETNVMEARRRVPMRRAMLARAMEIYAANYAEPSGRVRATFDLVFLAGWAPGPNQPVPKRPGSATARLADALGSVEVGAGVPAGPDPDRRSDT